MDITERRRAADALRAIKRGGEGWFSLSDAVLGRPAPRDEVVARLADLIDPGEDVSVDAYDLLPKEEREALRWVHGHGGLREAQNDFDEFCCLLKAFTDICNRLVVKIPKGSPDASAGPCIAVASGRLGKVLDSRLMPDGMEWPRYEDNEPVRLGDEFTDHEGLLRNVAKVCLMDDGYYLVSKTGTYYLRTYRQRVKRPAPKVYDADGVEIRVGDHVWNEVGTAFTAIAVDGKNKSFKAMRHFDGQECEGLNPAIFTHRAPVLAADGEPLEAGQTVYVIANGKTHHVTEVDAVSKRFRSMEQVDGSHWLDPMCFTHQRPVLAADGRPLREGETAWNVKTDERYVVGAFAGGCVNVSDGRGGGLQLLPSQLTHTKPESPKRCRDCAHWQKDPTADNMGVCWFFYHEHEGQDCYTARLGDIGACEEFMPRASALAERERDE